MQEQARPTAYEFADFRLDAPKRLLLLKGSNRPLPLSARAFDALLLFLQNPGRLLDKSTLMAAIWPNAVVEENNLNQCISALRRVLGERPEEHRYIVTEPGRGYRFVAPVSVVAGLDDTTASPRPPVESAPMPTAPEHAVGSRAVDLRAHAPLWAFAAAGLLLVASLAWYLAHTPSRRADRAVQASKATSVEVVAVQTPRLAVLPFDNLSPDPKNAFFADGLHEEIISTLARQLPGIEVISRTTMMSYRSEPPKPLAAVARELRASHVMEGSVRREANKVRLTLQLIDARTDGHVWAASYDRTLADVLNLESQVAQEVAEQLSVRLARGVQARAAPIRDTEVFDLYLKAVLALRRFLADPTEFQVIDGLLTRVIERDPSFALAYAQRARARSLMFITGHDVSEASVRRIRADLDAARRLTPEEPLVLAATGYFLMCTNDTTGALQAYQAADAAGLAQAEWLIPKAHLLLRRSRVDELDATLQRMLVLDPADPLVIQFAAYHFWRARQPREALQVVEYARKSFPALYDRWRGRIMLDFGGQTQELRTYFARHVPIADPAQLDGSFGDYVGLLMFEHRYAELKTLLDRAPAASAPYYFGGVEFGPVGNTPTALFRGWTDMLRGDRAGAAQDGRAVLQFVGRETRTAWNGVHLDMLRAAAHAFAGDCARARADGKRALALVPRSDNAVFWSSRALQVAQIDAWCGDQDEAVALLRQLATGRPGFGPAVITRDPLLAVPLARLPAYRSLADGLEGEMRAHPLQ
jgi:TolB-like protein/DNA-binding winged helix-turn-helix (wHTH) protein